MTPNTWNINPPHNPAIPLLGIYLHKVLDTGGGGCLLHSRGWEADARHQAMEKRTPHSRADGPQSPVCKVEGAGMAPRCRFHLAWEPFTSWSPGWGVYWERQGGDFGE